MRPHNVRAIGCAAVALALGACGTAKDAAEDFVDDLRDASSGLLDAGGGWDASLNIGEDGAVDDAGSLADGGGAGADGGMDSGSDASSDAAEAGSDGCGDGFMAIGEYCDTAIEAGSAGACPSSCSADPQNACSRAMLVGTGCAARCEQSVIAACTSGDGCCANGCAPSNDSDCQPSCGNGVLEGSEVCDGNCPSSCDDGNACTSDGASGQASSCDRACTHIAITACQNGDGCCAPGCNNSNDSDCSPSCGDQIVNNGERCDGNCPSSCVDTNACTSDVLSGSAAQCNVQCSHNAITACQNGDGCCPASCNGVNDDDCEPECGNGIVEPGEECEPASSNDASCADTCLLPATECLNKAEDRGESRSDACVVCGCNGCASQLDACFNATDKASSGPASGTSRASLCAAVVDCARDSGCSGDTCYCGSTSGIGCLTGANGPCKTQIERAAESTSALTIQSRKANTSYALGRANAVSDCSVAKCKTQCGL